MKKILFGAGEYGRYALNKYGKENVFCFVDNDTARTGQTIDGVEIISFEHFLRIYQDYEIILTVEHTTQIKKQLEAHGIYDYKCLAGVESGGLKTYVGELVYNPYAYTADGMLFQSSASAIQLQIEDVNAKTEELYRQGGLFNEIEIETINRCNGGCSFCPVSVKNDTREYKLMSEELFRKIIDELAELSYSDHLALFSNNEPFLDERIISFHQYARSRLPHAKMHLYTNGTLLTIDKFQEIVKYLDELIIDNYNQELKLIPQCAAIADYCEAHPELKEKVTIVLRKIDEVLTTRGGDAPNAPKVSYPEARCVRPFQQMIIRPDGKVSLCCNDALGKNTLGDVSKDTLVQVWYNDRFKMVRECLYQGRENWEHCKYCDVFCYT
ncbi:MAG: radical SAM protein [Muribaculum sp.]|nr:radical SAM protein [Muribaculum sp.]